jgi:hypothetical protein
MHSTSNLEDGYMGSGKLIRYSIRKHGLERHEKEILEFLPTRFELIQREKEIVNEQLLNDKSCMNLKEGGTGGRPKCDKTFNKFIKAGTLAFQDKMKTDPEFKERFSKATAESNKRVKRGWSKNITDWTGKKHTSETIEKMKRSKAGHGSGQTNSQWGTCWVNKDGTAVKIKQDNLHEFLDQGWAKGRKQK